MALSQANIGRIGEDILHDRNDMVDAAIHLPADVLNELVPRLRPSALSKLQNVLTPHPHVGGLVSVDRGSLDNSIKKAWRVHCNSRWGVDVELDVASQTFWQSHIQDCVNALEHPDAVIPLNLREQIGRADEYTTLADLFVNFGHNVREIELHHRVCVIPVRDLIATTVQRLETLRITGIRLEVQVDVVYGIVSAHIPSLTRLELSNTRVPVNFFSRVHGTLSGGHFLDHTLEHFSLHDVNIGRTSPVQDALRSFIRHGRSLRTIKLSHCRFEYIEVASILREIELRELGVESVDFSMNVLRDLSYHWNAATENLPGMPTLRRLIFRNSGIMYFNMDSLVSTIARKVPNVELVDLRDNVAGNHIARFRDDNLAEFKMELGIPEHTVILV